jgi:FtsP/CotA-like multicopper oxidase with cupredoxin domain
MRSRHLLKTGITIAFILMLLPGGRAQTFVNPVPIPYLMTGDTFNLKVDIAAHNFNPNLPGDSVNIPLRTYCYNQEGSNLMTYLGPTMVWRRGQSIRINVNNGLSTRTTVHWHGLNLPAEMDGGPHETIEANSTWHPDFAVIDAVQTAWYHSHLMDSTTLQVIYGLAGMLIVEDPVNDNLRSLLPHDYGMNDFPIVIQEKGFNFTNHLATSIDTAGGGTIHTPGNGPFTLINGVMNGVLHVPAQMVRLRMLNGSPRKSFQVGITAVLKDPSSTSFETMWLTGTDGGYTALPLGMDSTLISPGERMEFLQDFSGFNHGDTLYLSNLVRSVPKDIVTGTGGGSPLQPIPSTPGDAFLAFVVDTNIQPADPIFSKPSTLLAYSVDTSNVFKRRIKNLTNMGGGSGSGGMWTIDGTGMDMSVINDTLLVNTKEMWTINNTTNVAHPLPYP